MFTIKFMRDGGYSAMECKSYGVSWATGGNPIISLNISDDEVVRHEEVTRTAYIMNAIGKTIDHIVSLPTAVPQKPDGQPSVVG